MKKPDYDHIARFYDKILGRSKQPAGYISNKIKRHNPEARSVLELGCGTGTNLDELNEGFEVTGIDISGEMLKMAKKKVRNGDFYLQDIRDFRLEKKFDLIICMYDTINHLTLFNDWKKTFANVYKHLNDRGLFVFDFNTLFKLGSISFISPVINKFNSNYLIFDIKKISRSVFNWNLKIFENMNKNNFKLHEINIKEASFETNKIADELSKHFALRAIDDERNSGYRANSERIYFVCQKN